MSGLDPKQKAQNMTPGKTGKAEGPSAKGGAKKGKVSKGFYGLNFLFYEKPLDIAALPNEASESNRNKRMRNLLWWQAVAISGLVCIILLGAPLMMPTYRYIAVTPDKRVKGLVPLVVPNLTNQALLSWVVTSVTEILTLGFGDFEKQLVAQKKRFTSSGWDSFRQALFDQGLRDTFKQRQLVLTTIPTDVPVIVAQGPDAEGVYQWVVEMPIIMTFATNNNVTSRQKSIVRLTIVRVPPQESISGMAIKIWKNV